MNDIKNINNVNQSYNEVPLYEIYYAHIQQPKWYDIISYNILKHLPDNFITNKLLYYLDKYKFGTGNNREKLVDIVPVLDEVKSIENPTNHISEIIRTKPYDVYELELDGNIILKCADNHIVCAWNYFEADDIDDSQILWINVKDLTTDYLVMTEYGWKSVVSIKKLYYKEYMCDLSILEDSHDYFVNNILSHNTTTVACYFAWVLTFHDNKNTFVTANTKDTGMEIISKIKIVLEGLPFFMKPGILNISDKRIKFENGSSLKCGAASKTPATGDSIQILYVDEAAVIAPNIIDEYWASVYPTMSSFTGHQIIMSSTPRGKGNLFYNTYTKGIPWDDPRAYLPENSKKFITSRVDWWEVPGRGPEWEAEQRADLGDEKFNREFGLSFESSTSRLINGWYVKLMQKIKTNFVSVDLYNVPQSISSKIYWAPDFNPDSLSYNDLMTRIFLFVIDTAQGIEAGAAGKEDADYNVINIFEIELLSPIRIERNRKHSLPITVADVIQYKQVGIYLDNFKDEKECANAAKYLAFHVFKYGLRDIDNVRILIEMNFNGNNWLTHFKSHPSYDEQIIIKTPNGLNQTGNNIKYMLGYKTTAGHRGKSYYCELGEKMMRKRQIIVRQYSPNINESSVYQLENFGKNKKGTYEGAACHDDISITCFFICIASEQLYFKQWVEEWIERLQGSTKVNAIRYMLEIYVETEAEITDEQFTNFYRMASSGFGKVNHQSNTYGNLLTGNYTNNNMRQPRTLPNLQPRRLQGYSPYSQNITKMSRFL